MRQMTSLFFFFMVMIGGVVCRPVSVLAEPETHEVIIEQYNFDPPDLLIIAGDTVVWQNEMTYGHWVISGNDYRHDNRFFSPILFKGHTFSFTFREPGDYFYYCPIHNMQAMVIVIEPEDATPDEIEKFGMRRRIR